MKTIVKMNTVLVLLFFSVQTFAQLSIGPQIGISASTQSELGNICNDDNIRSGINAGLTARYETNEWFAIKSGLFFNQKGSKEKDSNEKYHINYLELPVKAEFSAPVQTGKDSRIFFATGPYIATRLKAEMESNGITTDIKELTNSIDTGLSFELGFQLPVAKQKLMVSLNYDMGLSEAYKDQNDQRNKNLSLNLGFLF